MRREQILKICLNHVLDHDIEYKPKDDKSWRFVVNDFSEGEVVLEQFCLRFKTPEIAQEFKQAIDDALNGITSKQNGDGEYHAPVQPRQSLQAKLNAEEEKKVNDLKLPKNFFEYKDKSSCTGCRGCKSEEFVFPEVKANNLGVANNNPLPLTPPAIKLTEDQSNNLSKDSQPSQGNFSANSFGFGFFAKPDVTVTATSTVPTTTSSFFFGNQAQPLANTAAKTTTTDTAKPAFSFNSGFGNSIGGGQSKTGVSIFGGSAAADENSNPAKTTGFSFGGGSIFAGSNVSTTSAATTTPATSMFGGQTFSFNKQDGKYLSQFKIRVIEANCI